MKKFNKITAAALALCAVSMTACGNIDISDIKGNWTVETIDGVSPAKYAEKFKVNASKAAQNLTITEDSITIQDVRGSTEYDIMARTNGFQAAENGKSIYGYVYNEKTEELSTNADFGKGAVKVIYKKGTTDIDKLLEAEKEASEEASEDDKEASENEE